MLLALLAGGLLAAGWWSWRGASGRDDAPAAAPGAAAVGRAGAKASLAGPTPAPGVAARPADAANRVREEYVGDASRKAAYLAALADDDILDPQVPGAAVDQELRLALLDPVTAYRDEESCRERFADWPAGERCAVRIELVVERTGPGEGTVAYARGRAAGAASPACEDFARCMAGARLGRRTPLPGDAPLRPAALTSAYPASADRPCNLAQLRSMRAAMQADLEDAETIPAGELPDGAFRTAFQERLLDYLDLRIQDCGG